jgi:hypothetical protein
VEDLIRTWIDGCANRPAIGAGSECSPAFQSQVPKVLGALGVPFSEFADAFAREVGRQYLAGEISFEQGDNTLGWLHGFALLGSNGELLDGLAWQVYQAFDAGEYHPVGSAAGEDLPAKYTVPRLRQLLASPEA